MVEPSRLLEYEDGPGSQAGGATKTGATETSLISEDVEPAIVPSTGCKGGELATGSDS